MRIFYYFILTFNYLLFSLFEKGNIYLLFRMLRKAPRARLDR